MPHTLKRTSTAFFRLYHERLETEPDELHETSATHTINYFRVMLVVVRKRRPRKATGKDAHQSHRRIKTIDHYVREPESADLQAVSGYYLVLLSSLRFLGFLLSKYPLGLPPARMKMRKDNMRCRKKSGWKAEKYRSHQLATAVSK